VRVLCDDVEAQVDHATFTADEIAARFHHRLVAIHPFANGNGRHARQMADMLLQSLRSSPFTWGSASLNEESQARDRYLAALRAADAADYGPLFAFMRSRPQSVASVCIGLEPSADLFARVLGKHYEPPSFTGILTFAAMALRLATGFALAGVDAPALARGRGRLVGGQRRGGEEGSCHGGEGDPA
jgi:hypothetical protein